MPMAVRRLMDKLATKSHLNNLIIEMIGLFLDENSPCLDDCKPKPKPFNYEYESYVLWRVSKKRHEEILVKFRELISEMFKGD